LYVSEKTQTNTVALIREWSMDGADGDLDGRFGWPVDIHALVAERGERPDGDEALPPEPSSVLMKPAGEDDWRELPAGISDPD
jgi:hypothetical protein